MSEIQAERIMPKDVAKLLGISVQQLCKETGYSRIALNAILKQEYKDIRARRWNRAMEKICNIATAKNKADQEKLNEEAIERDELIDFLFKLGVIPDAAQKP